MSATSILKAYSRIAILMGILLISLGLAQEIDADSSFHVKPAGAASKGKTQATNDGIPLEIGRSIEKQIAAGQTDSYRLTLTQGQYVLVVVEQKGVDVVVVLFGPDGKKLDEVDSPNGKQGTEPVSFIATISGNYGLGVHTLENAPAGRYEIKIAELRIATEQDQKRVLAGNQYRQGRLLRKEGTAESYGKAIEKYEEALRLF